MNNDTLKIDHPVYGSKDMSDSLACAVQNCINHRTAEDVVSDEFSESDLVRAFVPSSNIENLSPTINKQSIQSQFTQQPQVIDTYNYFTDYNKQNKDDEIDMEYFRF